MRQGACRTGEYALQAIAGEVTGLLPRVDIGYTDTGTVIQFSQFDCLYRADLHTLATLDAGGEELLLILRRLQRTWETQPD